MASPEFQPKRTKQELTGTVVKYSGVVIGILGILSLNLPAAFVGGGAWLGGKWIENTAKNKRSPAQGY